MKKSIILLLFISSISAFAQIPANYYDSAIGLSGYTLKSELHSIISNGHVDNGYDGLYDGYVTTDSDYYYENDGTVLDMYSEKPTGPDAYNYTHNNNTCGTYNSESDCYNREHIVPQSVFNQGYPMRSDIHFVVPTDGYVNNRRSNYAFGEVSNPSWTSTNGSKLGSNTYGSYTGTVFEPIDEFKGDIARMLFYFATRYETQVDSWSHPMFNGTEDQVFADWFLSMLLEWHANDPVNQREIDRNVAAYNYQGNANPFIDHPEWVNTIWNPTPDTESPTAPTNLTAGNTTNNSTYLQWNAATDNVGVTSYEIYQNDTFLIAISGTSYTVTGLIGNTDYNFYVIAKDAAGNSSPASNTVNITTPADPVFLITEDFNDCNTVSNNFVPYSEASNKDWTCLSNYGYDNTGCYQINGYNEDEASKDWLITTNPIDFSTYVDEKLSVYLKYTYGTTPLELLYSNDYSGSGDPADATWFSVPNVTIETPSGSSSETIQDITDADISSINGSVYLAFKYYSNGAPTRWNIDNFVISSVNQLGIHSFATQKIDIFPNPSSDYVMITTNDAIKKIHIYNPLGQEIVANIIFSNENTLKIDFSNLSSGTYLINIGFQNNIKVVKFIKN